MTFTWAIDYFDET